MQKVLVVKQDRPYTLEPINRMLADGWVIVNVVALAGYHGNSGEVHYVLETVD